MFLFFEGFNGVVECFLFLFYFYEIVLIFLEKIIVLLIELRVRLLEFFFGFTCHQVI